MTHPVTPSLLTVSNSLMFSNSVISNHSYSLGLLHKVSQSLPAQCYSLALPRLNPKYDENPDNSDDN